MENQLGQEFKFDIFKLQAFDKLINDWADFDFPQGCEESYINITEPLIVNLNELLE